MSTRAKRRTKLQRQLGQLRATHGRGMCWVCGSTSGVKTCREGYGTRCSKCIRNGLTNDAVEAYSKMKAELEES